MLATENYYILRTPAAPIDQFLQKSRSIRMDNLGAFIKEMVEGSDLHETLYLASPELLQQYRRWLTEGLEKKQEDKLMMSIYKYLLRLCSRCTPFGLFAGCAMGEIGPQTDILL